MENKVTLFNRNEASKFCSKVADTIEERRELFNALEKCDVLLNDIVGSKIKVKDVFCEEREVLDEETGEMRKKYRTILFDVDGKTYVAGAYGIFNSIRKMVAIFGEPTWTDGIEVTVVKEKLKNNRTTLKLDV